jgi:molybdate transport system regulatory protein
MTASAPKDIFLRVTLGPDVALGPGKAALLEGVARTGSISAAGRTLGMSYKRAWMLVEALNECFDGPLVEAAKGGRGGGGAHLTPLGEQVLAAYRRMEDASLKAIARDMAQLRRHVRAA